MEAIDFLNLAAMWAIWSIRPADRFKVLSRLVFVSENWIGEVDGYGAFLRYDQTLALVRTYVKYIIAQMSGS